MPPALKILLLGGYHGDGWLSIGRYQREMLRYLKAADTSGRLEVSTFSPQPGAAIDRLSSASGLGSRLASYWTRFAVYPRTIPRSPSAIYHLMDQSLSYLVRGLDPARTVVTCHDLLHFPLNERFRRQSKFPWMENSLYRYCVGGLPECAAIIAVSNRTKQDAIRYLDCDPKRIHVIHEGLSPEFLQPVEPEAVRRFRNHLSLPPAIVILHVGLCTLYKNIEGLIRATAILRRKLDRPVTLLRVGPPLTLSQQRLAQKLGVWESIRQIGVHGDDTLPLIYRLADCFVFPSLYEGFGFPPIEAMACGVPVVVSDRGSLPEVVGEAALYIDPDQPASIAEAVERIVREPGLNRDLRERGLRRSAQFRWENSARETLAVYESLARGAGEK